MKDFTKIELVLQNFEAILEKTSSILKEQIRGMIASCYKIKEYKDKNRHITKEIETVGFILMKKEYYGLAEKYWDNVTIKTKEFSDGKFNCGLSLANTGVSQLNIGKSMEGIHNIYLAYKDDKKILEQNNISSIDVGKEMIDSVLYTQFFVKVIDYFFDEVILETPGPLVLQMDKDKFLKIPYAIKSLSAVQLFLILNELKISIELFRIDNNFISRSKILTSLFGLCLWIESTLREKYKNGGLCSLLEQALGEQINFDSFLLDNVNLSNLDGLYKNIKNSFKMENNFIIQDAILLRLIRNYTGHNISVQNHSFFDEINEYVARILRLLAKCI